MIAFARFDLPYRQHRRRGFGWQRYRLTVTGRIDAIQNHTGGDIGQDRVDCPFGVMADTHDPAVLIDAPIQPADNPA